MTIVRIWRGVTLAARAGQYLEHVNKIIIPSCQAAEGNEGMYIMEELQGELAHFMLLSFWASDDALVNFTGAASYECDVVNPSREEKSLLIAFESTARRYKIVYGSDCPIKNKR